MDIVIAFVDPALEIWYRLLNALRCFLIVANWVCVVECLPGCIECRIIPNAMQKPDESSNESGPNGGSCGVMPLDSHIAMSFARDLMFAATVDGSLDQITSRLIRLIIAQFCLSPITSLGSLLNRVLKIHKSH
jgi:hypothetical protein